MTDCCLGTFINWVINMLILYAAICLNILYILFDVYIMYNSYKSILYFFNNNFINNTLSVYLIL